MEFCPDARTRTPHQQAHGLAAVTEGQNKQSCPAILAGFRIAHHRTTAVVDLRFFSWCGEDDAYGFRPLPSAKLAPKALPRLTVAHEAVGRQQDRASALRV